MRIYAVVRPNLPHQAAHARLLADGLHRHGIVIKIQGEPPERCDLAVCWGWRVGQALRDLGHHVLVMERGYLGDRMEWTSCGFDGLNGRATFPVLDDPARFARFFGHSMRPWRTAQAGPLPTALLIGQVPGDAALGGLDARAWAQRVRNDLLALGWEVRYRPHPAVAAVPPLAEDFAASDLVVTYSSNTAVESVLAGIPTVALDAGSMAWPVALRHIPPCHDAPHPPDEARVSWAHRLAWCQWSEDELADGTAWEHLAPVFDRIRERAEA